MNDNSEIISMLRELLKQAQGNYSDMVLSDWLLQWIKDYKYMRVKEKTYKGYVKLISNHIDKDKIGKTPLKELSCGDIQDFFNSITLGRTRKVLYIFLNAGLEKAFNLEMIKKNPCKNVELIPYTPEERRHMTRAEERRFLKALDNTSFKNRVIFKMLLYTGIRKSEILCLGGIKGGLIHVKGTKTKGSDRYVPILPELISDLKRIESENISLKENFGNIERTFRGICRKAKITGIKIHGLRHTFATRCYESGEVDISVISQWLGHSDIKTTQIYIHSLLEHQLKNAKKIKKVYPEKTKKEVMSNTVKRHPKT